MYGPPTFLVDLPLGHYRFEITAPDHRTVTLGEQPVAAIAATRKVTVELPPAVK